MGGKTFYGVMDHPNSALNTKWVKAVKVRPCLKVPDLLPHTKMEGKPATMKLLNKMIHEKTLLGRHRHR